MAKKRKLVEQEEEREHVVKGLTLHLLYCADHEADGHPVTQFFILRHFQKSMSSFEAEDISDDDIYDLSQSSHLSQFSFSQDAADDPNFENDSEYLPESEDESSQEFSQVLYIGLNFSLEGVLHLR